MINKFIILCSRLNLNSRDLSEIESLLESDLNWKKIIKKANQEGVTALLYYNLKKYQSRIPQSTMEQLKKIYQINTARNVYTYRKIKPLLQEINNSHLKIAITKGARLAKTLYLDIGLRPFADVDLVVHPSDWQKLIAIMRRLGFFQNRYGEYISEQKPRSYDWTYYNYFQKNGLLIDVHCYPFDLRMSAKNINEFWRSRQKETIADTESSVFSIEYEFCKLCVHTQKHSYFPLIWLTDIAELSSREALNWDKVLAISEEEEIKAPVYYGLYLVNRLWPGTVSSTIVNKFKIGTFANKLLRFFWPEEKILSRDPSFEAPLRKVPEHTPTLFPLLSRKRIFFKLKTLCQIFFPHRAWVSYFHKIPPNSIRIYYHYFLRLYKIIQFSLKFLFKK